MTTQTAEQIITNVIGVNPFSIAMLQLCQLSYYPFQYIRPVVPMVPPIQPGGTWTCVWGPAEDWIEANLAYIAAYTPPGARSPQFTAVVVRGTDLDVSDPLGTAWQIWEDLDAPHQVAMPWDPDDPALIASGTRDGLTVIQDLTWNGTSLSDGLAAYLAGPGKGSFVVVTGHSLGGCLTTVVAPWLLTTLNLAPASVVPATFAAPTAGDQNFANYFNATFGYSLRYQNPFDIVPLAFYDLSAMEDIYAPMGLAMPMDMYGLILCGEGLLDGVSYVQPQSNAPALGETRLITTSWFDEAGFQHGTKTYMTLLKGMNFGTPPSRVRSPGAEQALRARLGPIRTRVQRMRAKSGT